MLLHQHWTPQPCAWHDELSLQPLLQVLQTWSSWLPRQHMYM